MAWCPLGTRIRVPIAVSAAATLLASDVCKEIRARKLLAYVPFRQVAVSSAPRTSIAVPLLGFESILIIPFTSLTRSRMLVRPKPLRRDAASTSKPLPKSLMTR